MFNSSLRQRRDEQTVQPGDWLPRHESLSQRPHFPRPGGLRPARQVLRHEQRYQDHQRECSAGRLSLECESIDRCLCFSVSD